MLEITKDIFIDEDRLVFRTSRSGGPGGQNVNKVNTRVTLFFDVPGCEGLSDTQKHRILSRLSTRADKDGVIRVVSQKFRTQNANRRAAVERLQKFLKEALKIRKGPLVSQRTRSILSLLLTMTERSERKEKLDHTSCLMGPCFYF